MNLFPQLVIFGAICLMRLNPSTASYQCGIRKHSFVQLVHRGWRVTEGQWPWHGAVFHKEQGGPATYACGGSLLGEKHVLTAAHCAHNPDTGYLLPAAAFELHFGQHKLSAVDGNVQIRDVEKVHVHPEHSTHRNDIAMLVMRLPVQFTDFVIPICMDQKVDRDLRNLEGQRGWIAGWGTTERGSLSDVLRTASVPVVSYLQCFSDDHEVFGNLLNANVFCAGDRNGTSLGTGDSGGGLYFSEGDRWVLRGIVSFAKADEMKKEVDTSKYVIFVNVQQFLTWIREVMAESETHVARGPKRISEIECDRYKTLTRKRTSGTCDNSRYPHTVNLLYDQGEERGCTGILITEHHVLSACRCRRDGYGRPPSRVQIDTYGIVGVASMTCHHQFQLYARHHDLAVLKLKTSVNLSSNIIPACLASNWTENLYDTLLQTGFGVNTRTNVHKFIESEENQVISKEQCDDLHRNQGHRFEGLTPDQLCVINSDKLRTSTHGYLGSPLQSVNTRTCVYTVVGVTSFGNSEEELVEGSNETRIDIYARVSYYLDWIEQLVWNEEKEPPRVSSYPGKWLPGNREFNF